MKMIAHRVVLVTLAVALSGCNKDAAPKQTTQAAEARTTAPQEAARKQRDWRLSPLDGDSLTKDCGSKNDTLVILCTGYLVGAVDMLDSLEVSTASVPEVTCVPNEVRGEQMAKVIIKYGNDHPEDLHLQGTAFTLKAFRSAWPCE